MENDSNRHPSPQDTDHVNSSFTGFLNNLDRQSKGFIGIGALCLIVIAAIFGSGAFSSLSPSYMDIMPADIQAANAPILIELYAPRCSACQKLDSETMVNPDVQSKVICLFCGKNKC